MKKNKFEDGNGIQNVDVFVVREKDLVGKQQIIQLEEFQNQWENYKDYVNRPHIEVKREEECLQRLKVILIFT